MHTEQDRKAFYRDQKNNEECLARDIAIQEWLDENPQIGRLNGMKFYIIINGETKFIKPLEKI